MAESASGLVQNKETNRQNFSINKIHKQTKSSRKKRNPSNGKYTNLNSGKKKQTNKTKNPRVNWKSSINWLNYICYCS